MKDSSVLWLNSNSDRVVVVVVVIVVDVNPHSYAACLLYLLLHGRKMISEINDSLTSTICVNVCVRVRVRV